MKPTQPDFKEKEMTGLISDFLRWCYRMLVGRTFKWTGMGNDNNWNNPFNWNRNEIPGKWDNVIIGHGETNTVKMPVPPEEATVYNMTLEGGSVIELSDLDHYSITNEMGKLKSDR